MNKQTEGEALTEREALAAAEIGLANLISYQSTGNSPNIHEFGQARRALEAVRAALSAVALGPYPTWDPLWKQWTIPDPKNAALSIPVPVPNGKIPLPAPTPPTPLAMNDAHGEKAWPLSDIYREAYDEFAGPERFRHGANHDAYHRAGLIAVWNAARQEGMKQERALWELAASSQEIERAPPAALLVQTPAWPEPYPLDRATDALGRMCARVHNTTLDACKAAYDAAIAAPGAAQTPSPTDKTPQEKP